MYFSNLTLSPICSLEFVDNKNEENIPITPFRYDKRSKVHKFVVNGAEYSKKGYNDIIDR